MSKRRTLKDKLNAQKTRQQEMNTSTESVQHASYSIHESLVTRKAASSVNSLLRVDQKHIANDLFKTLLISGILLTLLIGIYFYLGYN